MWRARNAWMVFWGLVSLVPAVQVKALADDLTPDDTYLICDNHLIAIETGFLMRAQNKFADRRFGASVMVGMSTVTPGSLVLYPEPEEVEKAFSSVISLPYDFCLDRQRGALMKYTKKNFAVSTCSQHVALCKLVSKNGLEVFVEQHNREVGGRKF